MTRISRTALASLAVAAALASPAAAPANDVAAAIAAGAVGIALGAALSKDKHSHHSHQNRHFSPVSGIECYDRQRACYHSGGGFSVNWTREIYG